MEGDVPPNTMRDSRLQVSQRECCDHYGAGFDPPALDDFVVISDGVYEGHVPVEGVRYQPLDTASGWWLTTDDYSGNVDDLRPVHFKHVVDARPELALYMALPTGFRFLLGGEEEHVWFDEAIASEK